MPTYTHGGDVWAYDRPMADFSANLHPLGMPEEVAQAARDAVADAIHYPDPLCRRLRQAIAARDGVSPDQVICGGGAADLILRLCQAAKPKRALVTAPTFSEYEQALSLTGCETIRYPLSPDNNFDLSEDFLSALRPEVEMVFLCTPNNPTGRLIPYELLNQIADRCQALGIRLVVDECFLELTDGRPMTDLLPSHPTLFLLRAFTKTYAIPGLRLGYGLTADAALLETLYQAGQPWGVSTVAQAAGIAACGCPQWPEQGRAILRTERPRLLEALRSLGLTVWEGAANYLLFRAPEDTTLKERLASQGVLIRSCANYPGLGPDYYRTAVATADRNERLIQTLKEVL